MPSVLIVDDDRDTTLVLTKWLEQYGLDCSVVHDVDQARKALEGPPFDLAILDLELPDGSGLELLGTLEDAADTDVVLVTGHATLDTAVSAFRGGAIDYLTKPVDLQRLSKIVADVVRTSEFRAELGSLREELRQLGRFGRLVGASQAMQDVYDLILRVAPTEASVLVAGETGTGKELVAESIHHLSRRNKGQYVPVNCGAISENLIESELFGHEKGAFTGADRRHQGFFERAKGGTLFLDEVTEMPIELQVKLLRALENRQIRRVGGTDLIDIDVRVVAATNRDPKQAVADGRLREDLLYRLLVFPIELPALRERGDDVLLLADHFLAQSNREHDKEKEFADDTRERLASYEWPGNVRELKNTVEGAFIRADDLIRVRDLPFDLDEDLGLALGDFKPPVGASIAQVERVLIEATLSHLDGDKKAAAKMLGISLKTLYNRLKQYEIEDG